MKKNEMSKLYDIDFLNDDATEMIDEFCDLYDEFREINPDSECNQQEVFLGWLIQKVANLQIITLNQQKTISTLKSKKY